MEVLRAAIEKIDDPRAHNVRFTLFDILFVALAATLCGSTTCLQMAVFARAKEAWLTRLLGWRHGPPSHDTFSRVFRILTPCAFDTAFRELGDLVGTMLQEGSVLALDGKAVRNAVPVDGKRYEPLHLVNLWACEQRIALAQVKAPRRNETAGALQLLDSVAIAGAIVTADALHCRHDIANAILGKGADYVLALKANRPKLLKAARHCIASATAPSTAEQKPVRSHGRFERRRATVVRVKDLDFPGIRAVACIQTWRGSLTLPRKPRCRYFVLSTYMPATRLLRVVRSHWGVEVLHWTLDVVFGEDKARTRLDHAPENLATLRKIAVNILQAHPKKMALTHKIQTAGWNDDFLLDLFKHAYSPGSHQK